MKLLSFVCRFGIHNHRCGRSQVAGIILAVFCLASIVQGQQTTTIKWDQPPAPATNVFHGWNQESVYDLLVTADDWVCTNSAPITRIRWWGSFIGWAEPQPPTVLPAYWRIHIWTDNPANQPPMPQPWSHPRQVIHEIIVTNVPFVCAGMDYHDDGGACPTTKPPSPGSSPLETCYLWDLNLNPTQYFYQPTGSNIFWISITAVYASPTQPQFPFGIKTRPRSFTSPAPDAAVSIRIPNNPTLGSIYLDGFPLVCPEPYLPGNPTNLWDLAFELYSATDTTSGSKWEQLPDLSTNGIDVRATFDPQSTPPYLLADDFQCTQSGFITNIVIWGSWLSDRLPLSSAGIPDAAFVEFTLSIHEDIPDPDGSGPEYSRPGHVVWTNTFLPGSFLHSVQAANIREGWLTPPNVYIPPTVPGDTVCHKYEFPIPPGVNPEPFFQQGTAANPKVYWLDVQARIIGQQPPDPALRPKFGWKTSVTNWNDDAVWAIAVEPPEPPPTAWNELRYPIGHPKESKSADLAFRINTGGGGTGAETVKWTQPPVIYPNPTNLFNGWNEPSIYGGGFWPGHGPITNIVADDWLCTNAQPVSDIHWWGSFLGWHGTNLPPQLPVAYRFSIWKDVPKNANTPFSHPGDLIWEYTVSSTDANLRGSWVGWDVDPRTSCLEVESCFKFDYVIPNPSNWFYQEPGTNIYWLSISAQYPAGGQLGNNPFGWKTRPHTSPPPDDAVRIFIPNAPVPGSIYINGEPIEYPAGVSWDMAFQLTSPGETPPTLDFGDAPEGTVAPLYPTRLINNGARHTVVPGYFLGAGVDAEPDGQPNAASNGDDINLLFPGIPFPPGDEDGVTFTSPLVPGFLASVNVVASANGFLNAWIDFGADGSWVQPGDQIFAGQPLVPGVNNLVFFVPAGASPNASYSRWRFSSVAALSFTGLAADGEVEDHRLGVQPTPTPLPGFEFGDAPQPPYPTLLPTGARHTAYVGFALGTNIDTEANGQPSPLFQLDDTTGVPDDEDGVIFTTAFKRGSVATASVTLGSIYGPGRLDAWVDFNGDGVWGVGEQVATSTLLFPGTINLNIPVPALAKLGRTGARFRLSSTGGLSPSGLASNGEVEDYEVRICQRSPLTNVFFTSITVTNIGSDQIVTLQWNAEVGVAYQVEYVTTLSGPHPWPWTDVGPEIVGPANSLTRTNAWLLERYYRIRVPEVCP